jgi:hypothetical protein
MNITVNMLQRGVYEISNEMNTICLKYSPVMRYDTFDGRYHPGWGFYFNGEKYVYINKNSAIDAAFGILRRHNAFDIEGFLAYLDDKGDELDERYTKTIRKIVEYGLRHECIAENQFVDWLVAMIYDAEIRDVVLFTNDMWLNDEYKKIKKSQYFIFKSWVYASDIWPDEKPRIDCGYKKGYYRGYRIEVKDEQDRTSWLRTEYLIDNQHLIDVFNTDKYISQYEAEKCRPTGRVTFLGYYKYIPEGPRSPIEHFERID